MNWSDERYVKLYVRKTATWITWPWQARAVFPSMLKEADGAGLIDVGTRSPAGTLAVMLGFPVEIVEVAVAAMLETETIELTDRGYIISRYIEAQEATKTDSRRKQDQRERLRAQVRATTEASVTRGHAASRGVTPSHALSPSSPAQLTTSPPPDHHQPSSPPAQDTTSARKRRTPTQVPLPDVVPQPPPRPPTRIGKLHEFFLEMREAKHVLKPPHGLDLGPVVPPDEPVDFKRSAAALATWLRRWPDLDEEQQDHRIRAVITAWLEESYWASPKPRDGKPGGFYPWGAFISEEQFAKACERAFAEEAA